MDSCALIRRCKVDGLDEVLVVDRPSWTERRRCIRLIANEGAAYELRMTWQANSINLKGTTMLENDKTQSANMIVGVFSTLHDAEAAVRGLETIGLTQEQITVISSSDVVRQHFPKYRPDVEPEDWKSAAVLGGTTGAVLAGLTSVAAIVTGAGVPILLAGGLASFLTGGVVGGLAGAMTERGFETEAADYYELAVADGKTLVAVDFSNLEHTDSMQVDAAGVLEASGAEPLELSKNPDFSSK